MLKKLGLQTRDSDLSSHTIIATTSPTTATATTSLKDSKLLEREREKKKAHHNKKVIQSSRRVSYDSIESESVAPQPHLPSSVYSPNPFPLDPTQPDGVSRYNAFLHIRGHDTREVEAVDIEIEETKGFVSGRSRNSVELDRADAQRHHNDDNDDDDDLKYELSKKAHSNTIQKLGVGLKGAFAKSGLGRSREKNRETEKDRVIMDMEKGKANSQPVDAVLQHHLQLQEQHLQQEQLYSEEEVSMLPPLPRGRDRERQRPISLDNYDDDRDYFVDKKTRLHSLSPPPAPGQEGRHSRTYWPEGHRGLYSDYQEQMSPFLGYQPPPHTGASSRYHRYQKQQYQSRAYKQAADLGYDSSPSRYERERRTQYRERNKSDRIQREPARGGARGGIRRHTGLSHVTNAASPVSRTSSEFADDEDVSSVSATNDRVDHQQQQRQVPDRLSRAKEWVASHNKNNNVAVPAPVMDREAALSSLPGAFPRRPSHRRSLDSDDYVLMTPPRRSYQGHAGGGYDSRERMAMMAQMQMHGVQRSRRDSMGDDGRYWSHQLEGYERDRHRQSRAEYEYERRGGFHGYASGGPDDVDEDESGSTLAPGSAIVGASKTRKISDNSVNIIKKESVDAKIPLAVDNDEEGMQPLESPRLPNKRRLILRLITLASSLLVLIFLIAASPVSGSSAPFSSKAGLVFHYAASILSILVCLLFVFNYFSRRLRRKEKIKRYILIGLDITMSIIWLIDIFICISKFPCAVGGQNGWCDMYNTSVFLGMVAFMAYLAAFIWDVCGSFCGARLAKKGPWIKPPPPGFDPRGQANRSAMPGWGDGEMSPRNARAWPGQMPGSGMGAERGPMKPKKSKALW